MSDCEDLNLNSNCHTLPILHFSSFIIMPLKIAKLNLLVMDLNYNLKLYEIIFRFSEDFNGKFVCRIFDKYDK